MNVQHSSKSFRWFTPIPLVEAAREVLGTIDLDPASEPEANEIILATRIITEAENALNPNTPWRLEGETARKGILNPPGGKVKNKSRAALFWQRTLDEYYKGNIESLIFFSFSLNLLRTSQQCTEWVLDFPTCIFRSRIAYRDPEGKSDSPPADSMAILVGKGTLKFNEVFSNFGRVH